MTRKVILGYMFIYLVVIHFTVNKINIVNIFVNYLKTYCSIEIRLSVTYIVV